MAIAVALAESNGNPDAIDHDGNGTVDRGLWQINSVHTQFSPACDYDPLCAAKAAFSISAGGPTGSRGSPISTARRSHSSEATAYVESAGRRHELSSTLAPHSKGGVR